MRLFGFGKKKETPQPQGGGGGGAGGGAVPRSEQLKTAIDQNNIAVDNLDKRQRFLEKKVCDMEERARVEVGKKNKRAAMEALKRKKMLQSELVTLGNAKMTLEQQVMTMEAAQIQAAAVGALVGGVQAQKHLQVNIDQVDQVMEEMQEQQDYQNEISQCFQQGTSMMDDDDLLEEFNALQAEELEGELLNTQEQMLQMGPTPSKPTPAQARPVPAQKTTPAASSNLTENEADELAALQARLEMA